ncbi:MAG TPA: hypothetical protein VFX76_05720, partial [Roseiflexaceae bacterium]|nr:hypothetical protein [Roseiflexaceae bacterium]
MYHSNRYRRILLPLAIAALSLGACGAPENQTGSAPSATSISATGEPAASADMPTSFVPIGDNSGGATASAEPTSETAPEATAAGAEPTVPVASTPIATISATPPTSKIDDT